MLAVSAVSASAADLAARPYTKAPRVAIATVYDWSGFYIGANGGGAWSRKCWDANPFTIDLGIIPPFTVSGPEGCHTASGATAGGQVGYRWQRAAWVFGLEAQGNWADLSGSNPTQNAFLAGFANRSRIDAIGLFTGQVGYAWNSFLLYVKGGAAVTQDKYEIFLTGPRVRCQLAPLRPAAMRLDGVAWSASEPSMGSRRTGHSRLNIIICSWAPAMSASPTIRRLSQR